MSDNKSANETLSGLSPLQKSALAIKELRSRLADAEYAQREPIAIIGMGCRFPQADGLEAYWRLLSEGKDAIGEVPKQRWDLAHFFDSNANAPGKISTRYGGFIEDAGAFDAEFFGISPHEAERIDPQQRILLEVAWRALEDAGLPPAQLRGSRTGVFVGITQMDYGVMQLGGALDDIDAYTGTGNGFCFAAGRLAYLLGLQGPAFSVDTACSSSMVALHQACQALRNRECDFALVAGSQLNLTPAMQVFLSKTQSFAPDGRCRTFDEAANGFVLGEGVGVIVLRRLGDAEQAKDPVRALVRASGVNHDGPASGLTVPNEHAQQDLIAEVHRRGGISADDINYVEAHGTATQLGDPIEVAALRSVFGQRPPGDELWLGSVKTNFGHLSAAAGIAGLIKVVLMIEHEKIAPNLHFKKPNSKIPWEGFSVRIPTQLQPWQRQQRTRRAGISSFGLSGTNTHIVLEEAPIQTPVPKEQTAPEPSLQLLCLSARNRPSLLESVQNMLDCRAMSDDTALADICFSANSGRDHFNARLTFVADSKVLLKQQLASVIADKPMAGIKSAELAKGGSPRLAMLFSRDIPLDGIYRLAQNLPDVAASLRLCQTLADKVKPGLLVEGKSSDAARFAGQFALARLWLAWGMKPAAVAGWGIGELTALCVAGVLQPEQAFEALAGHAVDAGAGALAVYSGNDGALLPYDARPGYRFTLTSQADGNSAVRGLADAGFKTLLAVGEEQQAGPDVIGLCPQDGPLWPALLTSLSRLYLLGFSVDWMAFDAGQGREKVRLPGYAFQRQHYWRDCSQQPGEEATPGLALASAQEHESTGSAPAADTPLSPELSSPAPARLSRATSGMAGEKLSQLLEAQLALSCDAIDEVVKQQMAFLKQHMKAKQAQKAQADAEPATQILAPAPGTDPAAGELPPKAPSQACHQLGNWSLLLMAGKDKQALKDLTGTLANSTPEQTRALGGPEGVIGSGHARSILVHQGHEDAQLALGKDGKADLKRLLFADARPGRELVFMFPGVGDHYLNMALGLYRHEAVFRESVDRCCHYLKSSLGIDLLEVLYPPTGNSSTAPGQANKPEKKMDFRAMLGRGNSADPGAQKLNQTQHSQPLVFIVEYALGRLWLSRGVQPHAMIGYSIGEYAAACLAGVIALEDVLKLITERARMIQALPAGVLLAVPLSEEQLLPLLNEQLSLSIVSTANLCVVGGTEQAVSALEAHLQQDEVVSRRLPGTHAFHSHMLAPLHDDLIALVQGFNLRAPEIPYISNLTGQWISDHQATDPGYWARHTWQTVRFADGLATLLDSEGRIFLEVGPGQSLGSFVLQHPAAQQLQDKIVLPSLKNRYEKQPDEAFLLASLGKLWLAGINFN
ncbi:beta-ketoacyl synthase N-terminal-like domain-containing protein [Thalassomonas sp. RHCl1]|uniref:type I polyketide synthase n=1 Tax=Thalassomonas sp. RHCl1 TaxID=2995320 RepID=UPI00248CD626|nr:beta-ketoacyl synthase N-terminal-like domain-containing protein [Thalassomonas sp. RHCl1]